MDSLVTLNDFETFFQEAHGVPPYPWQSRLAAQVVAGTWPEVIDVPTGAGKTATLDIAVFALACQAALPPAERTAPRRVFFCVNRRVIVDAAYQRALRLAERLLEAERRPAQHPTLARVAAALRTLSTLRPESAPPLDVLELRGGLYRDNRWARSATHPLVVCTTVDQFGSRLLFRGYGVSDTAAPIQAGLAAYDSLVLLDEAHMSRPFLQTLAAVRDYLDPTRWAEQAIGVPPLQVVPMTATPPEGVGSRRFSLDAADRAAPRLHRALTAAKPAKLKLVADMPKAVVAEAKALLEMFRQDADLPLYAAAPPASAAIGVIVNRVATARAVEEALRKAFPDAVVELVIGAMRPYDRDAQQARLAALVGPDRPDRSAALSFVVSTQCLEVGADYDFDALITECAALDALRQRFGRLNRRGRPIRAQAVILMDEKAVEPKKPDPIYGDALPKTWAWLQQVAVAGEVDFGVDAFDALLARHGEAGCLPSDCLGPTARREAAALLPAHLDLLCQTSPRPALDPQVALLLHGPQPGEPDVQVCWRADLDAFSLDTWSEVVSLLPPTAAECMTVPLSRLRRWLTGDDRSKDVSGDLLGGGEEAADAKPAEKAPPVLEARRGLLWRGLEDNAVLTSADDLRPGDTLVLPVGAGGWDALGHVPANAPRDVAEPAAVQARDRAVVRLHPSLTAGWPPSPTLTALFERIADPEATLNLEDWRTALRAVADELESGLPQAAPQRPAECSLLTANLRRLADPTLGIIRAPYPDGLGYVLVTRKRLGTAVEWATLLADDGEDERSFLASDAPVTLAAHSRHVRDEIQRTARALPLTIREEVWLAAAEGHDWGKADERFQALLRRADRTEAWLLGATPTTLLAKSDALPLTPAARRQARERAGLPSGFRHEMLSVQMLEAVGDSITDPKGRPFDADELDLILYLVGAHHGRGRPFAPVVADVAAPDVTLTAALLGRTYTASLTTAWREKSPPHRLDSGVGARFWRMQRRYGWWGAAYLEAVLRLADQQASADEERGLLSE
ncbi:MAG: type I-U CRISPR-associated helicase/endonuclease Cas3 [Chloracidobacterium sp.]|nr:type I-U CRISPR-associated helicase/endonuclease Cas3 [Chloracidobacterium sp.]MDW8216798.1 type I-U CRISPR-associated helicase/endonuclease Cas3 [Acidobacteriota bacterium]